MTRPAVRVPRPSEEAGVIEGEHVGVAALARDRIVACRAGLTIHAGEDAVCTPSERRVVILRHLDHVALHTGGLGVAQIATRHDVAVAATRKDSVPQRPIVMVIVRRPVAVDVGVTRRALVRLIARRVALHATVHVDGEARIDAVRLFDIRVARGAVVDGSDMNEVIEDDFAVELGDARRDESVIGVEERVDSSLLGLRFVDVDVTHIAAVEDGHPRLAPHRRVLVAVEARELFVLDVESMAEDEAACIGEAQSFDENASGAQAQRRDGQEDSRQLSSTDSS